MRERKFTSSELRRFQDCPRSWYLQYFLGYGPKRDAGEVGVSRVGTLYHLGVETYYKGGEESVALERVAAEVSRTVDILLEQGRDAKKVISNGELVRLMLEGYFEWLAETGADADLQVVSVEEAIESPFDSKYFWDKYGVDVSLLGKTDLRAVRRSNGKRLILDNKSVQGAQDQQILAPMSPQFKHYALIELLRDGELVDGALVRWARRVKRSARSTPPFYGQVHVGLPAEVLRSYYRSTWELVDRILRTEERLSLGADPNSIGCGPRVSRDCGRCIFRPVCPVMDDETADATNVLRWGFDKVDPLERYATETSAEEEDE